MLKRGNKRKNRPSLLSWYKRKRANAGRNSANGVPKAWYQHDCPKMGVMKSNIIRGVCRICVPA